MDVPTYQQVLADLYDETPTNVLVHQNEYEEEIPSEDHHPDELEHQEEFQKEQPSRQMVEIQTVPSYVDKTKLSVTYEKDVQTRILNIDSRFRAVPNDLLATNETILALNALTTSTNFLYKLTTPIKNVISVRVSSIEIPNTYYNFSAAKGNVAVRIFKDNSTVYNDIQISEGNYFMDTTANTLPNNLAVELETQLNNNSLGLTFTVIFNLITARLTISADSIFGIDFLSVSPFLYRSSEWGLGHNLGFDKTIYVNQNTYTGTKIVDTLDSNYLLLQLDPDWIAIKHWNAENTEVPAFAKIIVDAPKNSIIYEDGSNSITKEYWLNCPNTIRSFSIRLLDPYGNIVDLLGADISLTVELKEVMNPSLYNHYTNSIQS